MAKIKRLVEYVKYDTNNNVIEIGNYGELFSSQIRTVNSDSSITITHSDSWNFKKLGSVVDYEYNSNGQLVKEESWNMENNKKDYLIWKKLYSYDS